MFKQESIGVQDTQLDKFSVCNDSEEWLVVGGSPPGHVFGLSL